MAGELDVLIVIFTTAFVLVLGVVMGRLFDVNWRCNIMRRFTRKNYVVLNITDKDGKYILSKVVNVEQDTISVGNEMWAVTRGRIYAKKNLHSGFLIGSKDIKFESGAPNVYVNRESITPVDFYPTSSPDEIIKPAEVGSTLKAWIANQLAKALASIQKTQIFLIIIIVLVVLNLLISAYGAFQAADNGKKLDAIQAAVTPISSINGQLQNGTLVITQKPGGGT